MKIVIVSHYFYPHVGGIEVVAYNQAKELARRGYDVVVITTRVNKEPTEENLDGFKIIRVPSLNIFERKWGIPYPVPSLRIFYSLSREIRCTDIVHIHDVGYLSSFAGFIVSKIYRKPLVLMQHIKKNLNRRPIVRIIQKGVYGSYGKLILSRSEKIVVCNREVMNWINKKDKTFFLENCVDTKIFKPLSKGSKNVLRKKYGLPLDKPIVVFAGRLVEKKGFNLLFEARENDYFILFVGDGVVPDYMKKDKNVKFVGFKNQAELSKLFAISDLFCLPSINEGFPLTILEAMASGLPVITTDHFGYEDYIDRKYVKLIDPNTKNIKQAIKEILSDRELRNSMVKYSRREVEKRFNWERNVDILLKIYWDAVK